jgi:hypothetical protein
MVRSRQKTFGVRAKKTNFAVYSGSKTAQTYVRFYFGQFDA